MKKKLLLHVGHHKTGSTSLQLALRSADDSGKLAKHKFHYCRAGRGKTMANHLLAKLVSDPQINVGDKGGWLEAAAEAASAEAEVIIISSEAFEGRSPQRVRKVLLEYFGEYDISIVQYVRPHLSRLLSSYTQKVKTGQIHMSFEKFVVFSMKREMFVYIPRLEEWSDCFPEAELIIRPFIREYLHAGDVVQDFCVNALKVEADFLSEFIQKEANSSPSYEVLALIAMYSSALVKDGKGKLSEKLEQKLFSTMRGKFSNIYPSDKSRKIGFSHEMLVELRDYYSKDAQDIDNSFFGGQKVFTNSLNNISAIEEGQGALLGQPVLDPRESAIHQAYKDLIINIVKESEWYKAAAR